ncbi:MAG: NADH dehydrogenase [Planctomycetes bacterium RIFCSPLOWO2_12_FULL_39_13]|nr:MAG: NADH dehydrogenase [Planctomycetes bacterium RIFCSPLOWO2_12_FULL_39_13]
MQDETVDISKVEKILNDYAGVNGALIPILQKVQGKYGYLPEQVINYVSERLNISTSEIVGVSTFYAQFHLKPRGKHIIKVCCGTACHVKNAKSLSARVYENFRIKKNETTEDRMFTFEEVPCLGACGIAPVVVIDEDVHGELSPDKFDGILGKYKNPGA